MCQHTSGDIRLFYDKALVFDELYPLELSLALKFTIILQIITHLTLMVIVYS